MENKLRNIWELKGNIVGTHRELGNFLKNPSPAPPKLKRQKSKACLSLPIGCMEFLFPKELVTILGLGLQRTPYQLRSKDVRFELRGLCCTPRLMLPRCPQSNEIFIKQMYEILRLRIKCRRRENNL
jgi:hypothetical protein